MCPTTYCIAVPRHSLLFEYHMVWWYRHKFNFIYAHKKAQPCLRWFSQNSQMLEQHYVQISYTKFYQNRPVNFKRMRRNLFVLRKVRLSMHWFVWKLINAEQHEVQIFFTKFHKNRSPKYGKYAQILIYTPYVKCGFDCVNFNETHNQSVISCTQFYPKYTKNVWCTGKHSFTPVSKVWLLSWLSMKIWQRISCSQMEIYSLHIRHFLQVHKAHLLKLCLSTHIPVMKWPTTALSRQLLRLSQQCEVFWSQPQKYTPGYQQSL